MTNTDGVPAAAGSRLAVVTGASSGIGLELAMQFAAHGFDVVLAAEDDEVINAAQRVGEHGVVALGARVDLRTPVGVDELHAIVEGLGRPLDALALNAGVARAGRFVDTPLDDDLDVVRLNVLSQVHLAKLLVPAMVARHAGRVLVTASVASTMPGPYYATYAASKAFLLSFAHALRHELRDDGVTVTALMPGPTDTHFFRRSRMEDTAVARGPKDDPAAVAREGFEAMMRGRGSVVAGSMRNKVQAVAARLVPDRLSAALHARLTKPRSIAA